MVYTETTSTSWFGRIKNAIAGIFIGLILFIVGFPVLWWNEGESVRIYKVLKEVRGGVTAIASTQVDNTNEGKLVHTSGPTSTDEILKDAKFGISENAIRFRRSSEMYQWKERTETRTKKKLGGGEEKVKEYHYDQVWSSSVISSANFKEKSGHQNPNANPLPSRTHNAKNVALGAFKLNDNLISDIDNWESYDVASAELPPGLPANTQAYNGGYYVGNDPQNPAIGDVRISFEIVRPTSASVIAQQIGETFEPYASTAVEGRTFEMLQVGEHDSGAMIDVKETENKIRTWLFRGLGVLLMFIGLTMFFKPLSVLADVVPFIGNLVGGATGVLAGIMAVMFGSLTIGLAWIAYRPLVGAPLLIVTVACIVMLIKRKSKNKAAAVASVPAGPTGAPPPPPPPPA